MFDRITVNDAGNYTCVGYKMDDSEETYTMPVSVIGSYFTLRLYFKEFRF